ncbi:MULTISPECIES: hypothetical protein [unclassified Neorhizobium]|uniref:hypothetical protein n=1 Tax=unclassified Neorhizobium TaxID=2629175 RepID=UPI001FF56F37|nr:MULTISPECIES: hypothetical protein [unclassified Neorhizobium]MCJ9671292.1 hypothetical protein [Neorhizobium sp. SHOUNA12B]MCJ9742838.1 hypothetical protein [Neorhizobium sp. SHOUNA12A]
MSDKDTIRQRTLEAAHLQMIEGNPLDADDIAMFEMFDREGFSTEEQLAYVREDLKKRMQQKKELIVSAVARR